MFVTLGDETIEAIITRKNNKNIYFRFSSDLKLHITCNIFVTKKEIIKLTNLYGYSTRLAATPCYNVFRKERGKQKQRPHSQNKKTGCDLPQERKLLWKTRTSGSSTRPLGVANNLLKRCVEIVEMFPEIPSKS